jgi:hypothetical protein
VCSRARMQGCYGIVRGKLFTFCFVSFSYSLLSSSQTGAQVPGAEAEFTSSSGEVRASSVHAKKELGDEER